MTSTQYPLPSRKSADLLCCCVPLKSRLIQREISSAARGRARHSVSTLCRMMGAKARGCVKEEVLLRACEDRSGDISFAFQLASL